MAYYAYEHLMPLASVLHGTFIMPKSCSDTQLPQQCVALHAWLEQRGLDMHAVKLVDRTDVNAFIKDPRHMIVSVRHNSYVWPNATFPGLGETSQMVYLTHGVDEDEI